MTQVVEFYFDFGSPASWLAYTQLPGLAREYGAELQYKPVLLGGIFKATGNNTPAALPPKGQYLFRDLARFARRYGVALTFPPGFPANTLPLMRIITGVQLHRPDDFNTCMDVLFRMLWEQGINPQDETTLRHTLAGAGLDADALLALAGREDVKQALKDATNEAVERGLFGLPTFFVGGEMFWGQDRLDFVREQLDA
jgi:2-hydroxychromene-2-carboxylate isomerase